MPDPNPNPNPNPNPTPDPKDAEIAKLKADLAALQKTNPNPDPNPKPDDDLARKAQLKREEDEKAKKHEKALEAAIVFTTGAKEWLKTNATLLPKTVPGIFEQAEKENYGSAIEKDAAIKVGIISEFFAQQANLDLLTASQKSVLEDFKKLTKTDKQDRAQQLYDSIFEPTFETLKKVKRAEQVAKGHAPQSDADEAYREKLMKGSRKHYLGEKQ